MKSLGGNGIIVREVKLKTGPFAFPSQSESGVRQNTAPPQSV